MANEIIIFKTEDEAISVDVRFEAETAKSGLPFPR